MKTFIKLTDFKKGSKEYSEILLPRIEFEKNNKVFSYKYGDIFFYNGEVICVYAEAEGYSLKEFYFIKYKSLGKKNEDIKFCSLTNIFERDLIFIGNYFEKTNFVESYIDREIGYDGLLKHLYENYKQDIQFINFQFENESSIQHVNDLMLTYSLDISRKKDDYNFKFNGKTINLNEEMVVYFHAPFFKNDILKIELPYESIGIISSSHIILPIMKNGESYIKELINDKVKIYSMNDWMEKQFENSYRKLQILYKNKNCADYIYYLTSMH